MKNPGVDEWKALIGCQTKLMPTSHGSVQNTSFTSSTKRVNEIWAFIQKATVCCGTTHCTRGEITIYRRWKMNEKTNQADRATVRIWKDKNQGGGYGHSYTRYPSNYTHIVIISFSFDGPQTVGSIFSISHSVEIDIWCLPWFQHLCNICATR